MHNAKPAPPGPKQHHRTVHMNLPRFGLHFSGIIIPISCTVYLLSLSCSLPPSLPISVSASISPALLSFRDPMYCITIPPAAFRCAPLFGFCRRGFGFLVLGEYYTLMSCLLWR
ncbi:hypothetical protein DENSPDRAFT_836761 [Dentipellis sp. KUC8613]|nr:hypothetical protein DENSPDRAFT_836761 [Dentipellis sp. KUC8613]